MSGSLACCSAIYSGVQLATPAAAACGAVRPIMPFCPCRKHALFRLLFDSPDGVARLCGLVSSFPPGGALCSSSHATVLSMPACCSRPSHAMLLLTSRSHTFRGLAVLLPALRRDAVPLLSDTCGANTTLPGCCGGPECGMSLESLCPLPRLRCARVCTLRTCPSCMSCRPITRRLHCLHGSPSAISQGRSLDRQSALTCLSPARNWTSKSNSAMKSK